MSNYLNALVVEMQKYILETQVREELTEIKGPVTDQMENFCIVNFYKCKVFYKSFYMYKLVYEDNHDFIHENLHHFEDFSNFMPIVKL